MSKPGRLASSSDSPTTCMSKIYYDGISFMLVPWIGKEGELWTPLIKSSSAWGQL